MSAPSSAMTMNTGASQNLRRAFMKPKNSRRKFNMKRSPASGSELMSHAVGRGTGRLTLSGLGLCCPSGRAALPFAC